MNVSNLLEKIDLFNELVIESGFLRDMEAHTTALATPEVRSNLLALKGIATDVRDKLQTIHASDFTG